MVLCSRQCLCIKREGGGRQVLSQCGELLHVARALRLFAQRGQCIYAPRGVDDEGNETSNKVSSGQRLLTVFVDSRGLCTVQAFSGYTSRKMANMYSLVSCDKQAVEYPGHGTFWWLPNYMVFVPWYVSMKDLGPGQLQEMYGVPALEPPTSVRFVDEHKKDGSYWTVTGDGGVFYFDARKKTFTQPQGKAPKRWGPCSWPKGIPPEANYACCWGPQVKGAKCLAAMAKCPTGTTHLGQLMATSRWLWIPMLVVVVVVFLVVLGGFANLTLR